MAGHLLHLLNGDCAREAWERSGLNGSILVSRQRSIDATLVWRENYLHGELPETDDTAEFCRIRAAALHRIAPEFTEEAIREELTTMHRTLAELTKADRLVLWFDFCPFDRTMLARILALLAKQAELPELVLIAKDVEWNEDAFRRFATSGSRLTRRDLKYGETEWKRYRAGTCTADSLLAALIE